MTSERNVYTVRRKKSAVGKKINTSLADHRSARFASRYFLLFQPIFCLFPLRTVEPGPRLMLVRNLFLSFYLLRAVFKIQSVVRFTQYVVASLCFIPSPQFMIYTHQSSYYAKVVAKANLKWSGEGRGRRRKVAK